MCCLFPLPTTSYSIRPQYLIFFSFQWFPKLFNDDYLANYTAGVEATKVKVYNSCYHDNALEVFLKVVKYGQAHKGLDKIGSCLWHAGRHIMGIPLLQHHRQSK